MRQRAILALNFTEQAVEYELKGISGKTSLYRLKVGNRHL